MFVAKNGVLLHSRILTCLIFIATETSLPFHRPVRSFLPVVLLNPYVFVAVSLGPLLVLIEAKQFKENLC